MSFVLGRDTDLESGPAGRLGTYRALDGSDGVALYLDLDEPHAVLVVGKRGYGKSYTLGVIAETLARTGGLAPVIVDPMGAFRTLAEAADGEPVPAEIVGEPTVSPATLDPRSWCELVGLEPESATGGLLWQAASSETTIDDMCEAIEAANASQAERRAAINHLELARSWEVFDPDGLSAADIAGPEVTVFDVAGLDDAPMNAVCRAIAETLYRARVTGRIERLPWLLLDEAHAFFDGVAEPALRTILTRGRAPGVTLVAATQRPSAVPPVGISQSDVLVAHRLTAGDDLDALESAQPTYVDESLANRLPERPGEVVIVDDATETVHAARIRERDTPHGGASPRASETAVRPDTEV
ncbi:ATP-binding protein [Natronobacterium gregoryi]|uniref:ATP-binding protein n=2 Tax=Natronobacterium gregoryi TaxID=44930 RepID=L0AHK5_NATGS|nr:DUF87 domain-containing protein [Natronobacterium gregoryi]AFZ72545.1 putative ATPase [Natronobacterium gregoryi SP2]ELY74155.1 ATPase-like protein [Natronobacterium gregoryi SP2]PLK21513.1 ATP-binding protein [Natronobacterium gregoryi SP2]SFI75854.1 hypothetical protein SAMN05443661_10513 [Natronobacterium gregoryi]